jgi:PAS domain S-box-containing protein
MTDSADTRAETSRPTAFATAALIAQDISPDGFMLLAPAGCEATDGTRVLDLEYCYVNTSAERILGRSRSELLGQRMSTAYPGVVETGVLAKYIEVFERGASEAFELRYDRDGLDKWFRITASRTGELLSLAFADLSDAKRHEAEAREQSALNETLVRTGEALAGQLDVETIVQRLTDEATNICRAQFGSFFDARTDERADVLLLDTLSGAPREGRAVFPLPRTTPIFGITFRGEGVVRLDDVTQDPRFGGSGAQPKGQLPVVSYLAVPVRSRDGTVLGGLFFGHGEAAVFTARDERILVAVAAQAAVAIDNARLFQEAMRARDVEVRRARHAALHGDVGRALAAGGELRIVLQEVAQAVVDRLDTRFARIWTLDGGPGGPGELLALQASAGAYTHIDGSHARVRVGELKIGRIASQRRAHLTNDIQNDPEIGDRAWAAREGLVAFAGYPLVAWNRLIGVLATFSARPLAADTLDALRAAADTVAVSIERHRADEERERYRAEAHAQRDRLERIFAQAPAAVAVLRGPEHVFELANAPYRALIGNRDNVDGRPVRVALPELEGQGIYELLDRVYATGERFIGNEVPLRVLRRGVADDTFFNFVYEPMLDAAGEVEGIMVVAVEVTDQVVARKRAEALADGVRSSEERFRSLVTATSQVVFSARADGARVEDSPTWRAFTGRTIEQWRGSAWLDAVHPDDAPAVRAAWRRAVEEASSYEVEYRLRRHDDVYRMVLARAIPVRHADGSIREWVGTITDVTEKRLAERQLEFLAKSGKALTESLDFDVTLGAAARMMVPALADWCWVDLVEEDDAVRRLQVVHANATDAPLAAALQAFPANVKTGHPAAAVMANGRAMLLPDISDETLRAAARSPDHLELLRALNLRSAIIIPLSTHGNLRGVLTMGTARTSQHAYGQSELEFADEVGRRISLALDNAFLFGAAQAERKRAEEANRAKDDFLATMSHELRTPLNAMLGWVTLLRAGTLSEDRRVRALETIERNARVQAQLIDDVLDVSRIISGKVRLNAVNVSLLHVVEAAVETIRPVAEAKGVGLEVLLDADAGTIMGDPDRLQQVYWNLLANAVKFTPKGGHVTVRLERSGSSLDVIVEDTGKGISREFLPHVFDRFRQADSTITRAYGGLGLGLAIVKHLVALHGGTIEVQSDGEGKGARFVVHVPAASSNAGAQGRALEPLKASGTELECPPAIRGMKVLVVDDEADARELVQTLLEQCRAEVDTASSAADALALLGTREYDVIVSDIGMPGQDGYAFIAAVRALGAERGGRTPAVALTAYARTEDRTRALLAGFQSHVAKPVEPLELLVVVANVLTRRSPAP